MRSKDLKTTGSQRLMLITYSAPQLSGESHLKEPKFNVLKLGGEDKTLTGTLNGKDENQRGAE